MGVSSPSSILATAVKTGSLTLYFCARATIAAAVETPSATCPIFFQWVISITRAVISYHTKAIIGNDTYRGKFAPGKNVLKSIQHSLSAKGFYRRMYMKTAIPHP